MARGQDAPTQTGGQIDPYVQQSMAQNKQLASNRLIAAMQEAGATQRTAMSTSAQLQSQQIQQQGEIQQQAAQMEADDRRAAENIAAQREQNALTTTLAESHQRFEAGESTKRLDYERARDAGDDKVAEQRHQEMMAEVRASRDLAAAQAAMEDNRAFSTLASMQNKKTAMEEAISAATQAADEGERRTGLYTKTLERQTNNAMTSFKNLQIEERGKVIISTPQFGVPQLGMYRPQFTEDNYTGPGSVLQQLIADNGSSLSIGDLTSSTIGGLNDQIRNGKLDAEDVQGAFTALDAAVPAIDKRIEETSGREQMLWKAFRSRVGSMQDNLESLRNKQDKIVGQAAESVGSVTRRALGVKYPAMSFSTRMFDLRNRVGQIDEEAIQSMTVGIEPWEHTLLPIDPTTMTKYDIATREAHNAGLTNARQKHGNSGTTTKWGAE
jgi:hypothetical protein